MSEWANPSGQSEERPQPQSHGWSPPPAPPRAGTPVWVVLVVALASLALGGTVGGVVGYGLGFGSQVGAGVEEIIEDLGGVDGPEPLDELEELDGFPDSPTLTEVPDSAITEDDDLTSESDLIEHGGYASYGVPGDDAEEVTVDADAPEVEIGSFQIDIHEVREWADGDYEAELTVHNLGDHVADVAVQLVFLDDDEELGHIGGIIDELAPQQSFHSDFLSHDTYDATFDRILVRTGPP